MVWSKLAQKGGKQASGKGNGSHSSGGKSGGKTPAGGSGGAAAALAKQNAQIDRRMTGLENLVKKVLEGSTPKTQRKLWTCGSCGDAKCFESRAECHKCGVPRAGAGARVHGAQERARNQVDASRECSTSFPGGNHG